MRVMSTASRKISTQECTLCRKLSVKTAILVSKTTTKYGSNVFLGEKDMEGRKREEVWRKKVGEKDI